MLWVLTHPSQRATVLLHSFRYSQVQGQNCAGLYGTDILFFFDNDSQRQLFVDITNPALGTTAVAAVPSFGAFTLYRVMPRQASSSRSCLRKANDAGSLRGCCPV